MRKTDVVVPVIAAALFAGTAVMPAQADAVNEVSVMGTIRWTSSTSWVALTDAGHQPQGIASVQVLPSRVRVYYETAVSKVGVCSVTPDEGFAATNVRVGASVGLSYLDVFFYQGTSSTPLSPATLSKRGANVWVDCTHTV